MPPVVHNIISNTYIFNRDVPPPPCTPQMTRHFWIHHFFFFQLFTKTAQKIKALLLCQTANVQCWENDKKHGFLTFNKNARLIVWRTCNVICMFFVHETLKNITHFTVQLHVRQQSAEKPGTAFKLSPITSYLVLGNSIHKKMKISHFTVQLHVCKSTIRR